jgi:hypothetical protein
MRKTPLVPKEMGINGGHRFRPDRYQAGFEHALRGGQLDHVNYLRLSFRAGFRAAKLYARELRRRHGVLDFPMRSKFKLTVV